MFHVPSQKVYKLHHVSHHGDVLMLTARQQGWHSSLSKDLLQLFLQVYFWWPRPT